MPQNFAFDRLNLIYQNNQITIEDIYTALTRCKHLKVYGRQMINQETANIDVGQFKADSIWIKIPLSPELVFYPKEKRFRPKNLVCIDKSL